MSFKEIPFEEMAFEELDIEELESRLEMASFKPDDVVVEVGIEVSW